MHIYIITNKTNFKKYIGRTTRSTKKRFSEHKNFYGNNYIHSAMKKYGIDNFSFKILDSASTFNELKEMEQFYIKEFDTYNNGYNCTLGGDGTIGYHFSEETKKKMQIAKLGMYNGARNPMYKKTHSTETKDKISNSKQGQGLKEILQYDMDGNFITKYSSIKEAQNKYNVTVISQVCRGKRKSLKGYIWRYA